MRIAALRDAHELTQARLARLVGAHPMTVSRWERGVLKPNAHQRAILRALEVAARRRPEGARAVETRELAEFLNLAYVDATEIGDMKLSASNQFQGKVVELQEGPVTTRVVLEIAPRLRIVSLITTASVRRL